MRGAGLPEVRLAGQHPASRREGQAALAARGRLDRIHPGACIPVFVDWGLQMKMTIESTTRMVEAGGAHFSELSRAGSSRKAARCVS